MPDHEDQMEQLYMAHKESTTASWFAGRAYAITMDRGELDERAANEALYHAKNAAAILEKLISSGG